MTSDVQRWFCHLVIACGTLILVCTIWCIQHEPREAKVGQPISTRESESGRPSYIQNGPNKPQSGFMGETQQASPAPPHGNNCDTDVPGNHTQVSDVEISARFERRRNQLRSACDTWARSPSFRRLQMKRHTLPRYKPLMNHTVSFCPIEKVASSTWWGLFNDIRKEMSQRRVFGTNVVRTSWESDVSFVFVREPYGRLLSAYVDKLFSPNTVFWNLTGRHIVENFRANASAKSRRCGHDVTFSEFVKFFIHMQESGTGRDGHFVPTHDHCEICQHHYTYIGHLETLSEDMSYILKAIHSPVTYNKSYENSTIRSDATMVLRTMRKEVQDCMDLDEACRRLWKKWQIRGLISKTLSFPLTREQTRNISLTDFVSTALAALARADDGRCLRQEQKVAALREAYGSVSRTDLQSVRGLLWLDFELFGYTAQPSAVFSDSHTTNPASDFSYFDLYS